jgi:hypothetical protein
MSSYIGHDQRSIQRSIVNHVEYTLAMTRFNFDNFVRQKTLSIRDATKQLLTQLETDSLSPGMIQINTIQKMIQREYTT